MIEAAIIRDEAAVRHARTESVRSFAQESAGDHRRIANELRTAIGSMDAEFAYDSPPASDSLAPFSNETYDREYLRDFIARHEEFRDAIDQASSIEDYLAIRRFVALWNATAGRHANDAQKLLTNLPAVASNILLLPLAGAASLCMAAMLAVRSRLWKQS
jgi:predicted outer membrane protein